MIATELYKQTQTFEYRILRSRSSLFKHFCGRRQLRRNFRPRRNFEEGSIAEIERGCIFCECRVEWFQEHDWGLASPTVGCSWLAFACTKVAEVDKLVPARSARKVYWSLAAWTGDTVISEIESEATGRASDGARTRSCLNIHKIMKDILH
jgi:hypothetical protein